MTRYGYRDATPVVLDALMMGPFQLCALLPALPEIKGQQARTRVRLALPHSAFISISTGSSSSS